MKTLLIVLLFLTLLNSGAPLWLVIGLLSVISFVFWGEGGSDLADLLSEGAPLSDLWNHGVDYSLSVPIQMFRVTESPVLIAIPLFTIAGMIMTKGQISKRLVEVSRAAVGFLPGGLAVTTIVGCTFFAAISGASAVTIIAIGGMLYPALKSEGYSEKFSLGLLTSSGALGILVPPSLPLIIYGVVAKADINKLFVAGLLPGLLTMGALSIYSAFQAETHGVRRERFSFPELREKIRKGIWAILLPVLLLVGIYGGYTTAAEVSAVAVVYALVIEILVHKALKWSDLGKIFVDSLVLVGAILVILLMALSFTNFLAVEQIPQYATEWIKGYVTTPLGFLAAVNGLLLIVGCIMDIFSGLLIVGPLVVPIAQAFGVDLIHLGIVFVLNLEIGFVTPPFGINLFISSSYFRKSVPDILKAALPFMAILLGCLAVITYFENISLVLVR
ncbi:MAG: TRAP transporter large permease subunit [Bdellovibrionota bacterium]